MVFKDEIEKLVLSKVGKENHLTYQSKMALLDDLCTELGTNLPEEKKSVLKEIRCEIDNLLKVSDDLTFSYTFDFLNSAWREMLLNEYVVNLGGGDNA